MACYMHNNQLYNRESEPTSLLHCLHSPVLSDLCRKHKVDANPPPLGKKHVSSQALSLGYVPESVTPAQHAQESPVECVENIFCCAWRDTSCVKRSVVQNHVKSSKHDEGKKKLKIKQAREADLVLANEVV